MPLQMPTSNRETAGMGSPRTFTSPKKSDRSPRHAYDAGWKYLGWRSYIQPSGWKTVLANYGGAEAYRSPISIGVWSILLLGVFILGLKGFFFPATLMLSRTPVAVLRQRDPSHKPIVLQPASRGHKQINHNATPARSRVHRSGDQQLVAPCASQNVTTAPPKASIPSISLHHTPRSR